MRLSLFILMISAAVGIAAPSNTVTVSVITDPNGVLYGASTNFVSANGLAVTGSVTEVVINLATVSNTAVSAAAIASVAQTYANAAMSTGAAAQASAFSAMATSVAARALAESKVSTNNATYLQTITLAANALKSDSYAPNLIVNVSGLGTNKIIVSGANLSGVNGSFYYAGTNVPGVPVPAYSNSSAYYFIYGGGSAWLVVTAAAPYSTYYTGGASVTNAYTGGVTPPVVVYDQISSNTISAEIQSKLSISAVSWKTNLVIAPGGTTNTMIYLGAP